MDEAHEQLLWIEIDPRKLVGICRLVNTRTVHGSKTLMTLPYRQGDAEGRANADLARDVQRAMMFLDDAV